MHDPKCRKHQRRTSLRAWLITLNLLFAAVPTYAAASDGAEVLGQIAGGCCVHMAGALIQSAVSAKRSSGRKQNLRAPRRSRVMGETLRERCLLNDIMQDCYALGVRIERSGTDRATKARALIYYRHGCYVGPGDAPCKHADRVARDLGCEDAFDCGDLNLETGRTEPPKAERPCEDDDLCLAPFNVAKAKEAFAHAEARLPKQCKNDLALTKEVRVSVVFEPSGWAVGVWLDSDIAETLIAECIEKELLTLSVPPFEGEEVEVHKTLSLAKVPLHEQLVQRDTD